MSGKPLDFSSASKPLDFSAMDEPVEKAIDPRIVNATRQMNKKKPTEQEVMHAKLHDVKGGIAETLSNSHRILEQTSKLLTNYFARIPESQLSDRIMDTFRSFDSNNNGSLEPDELAEALAEMGKRPTAQETEQLLAMFDADGNGSIEIGEFEHMVRQQLNLAPTARCPCNVCETRRAEEEEQRRLEEAMEVNSSISSEWVRDPGALSSQSRLHTAGSVASVGDVSVDMRSTASSEAGGRGRKPVEKKFQF